MAKTNFILKGIFLFIFQFIFFSCNYFEKEELRLNIQVAERTIADLNLDIEKVNNKIEIIELKNDRFQDLIKALNQEEHEAKQFQLFRSEDEKEEQLHIISLRKENFWREYKPIQNEREALKQELERLENFLNNEKENLERYQKRLSEL